MGRHEDDGESVSTSSTRSLHAGFSRSTWPLPLGNTGRHSDDPLDDLDPRRSKRRLFFLWFMISLALVILIVIAGSMIDSAQKIAGTGSIESDPPTVTVSVEVPGPAVVHEAPGSGGTVIRRVPGPTITRTVTSPPTATPSPAPGPAVTVTVPGPVQYQKVPGPTVTVTKVVPGPTVTECFSRFLVLITCPS